MRKIIVALIILSLSVLAFGCTQQNQQSATSESTTETTKKEATKIRIGALPIEDSLPTFVAQEKGLYKDRNLDVDIKVFKSAQERDAALQAGQIDGFVGDIVAAAALEQGGTPISIVSVLLGANPDEGRFGILASPKSNIKTVEQLKGVPIAISSNTIIEYVVDNVLKEEGFGEADIKKVEIKAIPVRLEALLSGQAKAAALPDPLLAFGEKQGARLIIDDTRGANLSQVVLLFRDDFLDKNKAAVKDLLEAQDEAVEQINDDPDANRALLVKEARLPKPIETSYKINNYPKAQLPKKADVEKLLAWMAEKNIIKSGLKYDDLVNREVQP